MTRTAQLIGGPAVMRTRTVRIADRLEPPAWLCTRPGGGPWEHFVWSDGAYHYDRPCEQVADHPVLDSFCHHRWHSPVGRLRRRQTDQHSCGRIGPHETHQCCCGELLPATV